MKIEGAFVAGQINYHCGQIEGRWRVIGKRGSIWSKRKSYNCNIYNQRKFQSPVFDYAVNLANILFPCSLFLISSVCRREWWGVAGTIPSRIGRTFKERRLFMNYVKLTSNPRKTFSTLFTISEFPQCTTKSSRYVSFAPSVGQGAACIALCKIEKTRNICLVLY